MRSVRWFVVALSICLAAVSDTALAQQGGGWFGATVVDVTKEEADKLGWDAPHGAKVTNTPTAGSPADRAGIKSGDIILSIDRMVIDGSADLDAFLAGKQPGTELRLQVLSAGRVRGVVATLVARAGTQGTQVVLDNNAMRRVIEQPVGSRRTRGWCQK
jgi:S1-C subfamily serine protease